MSTHNLDSYLVRTPKEVALWCDLCELNAKDCECPDEHEGHWVTAQERALQEYEDSAYEWHHDEEQPR